MLEDVRWIKESDERVVEANERAGGESRYESLKRESMTRESEKRVGGESLKRESLTRESEK